MSTVNTTLLRPSEQYLVGVPDCSFCRASSTGGEQEDDWIAVPGYPFLLVPPSGLQSDDLTTAIDGTATASCCLQHYFRDSKPEVITAVTGITELRDSLEEEWNSLEPPRKNYVSKAARKAVSNVLGGLWSVGFTDTVYPSFPKHGSLSSSFKNLKEEVLRKPRGHDDFFDIEKNHKKKHLDNIIELASDWEEAQNNLRSSIGSDWPWGKVRVPREMALGTILPIRAAAISALKAYDGPLKSDLLRDAELRLNEG